MKTYFIKCIVFLLLFLSCSSSEKNDSEIPIIDIEKELDNFQISKLSTFARSIRYVPLETNDDCLVANNIKGVYLEDTKIFISDNEPFLKVFDAETGKYLYNVGRKGQGPRELPNLYKVDINSYDEMILLCWGKNIHQFDFDGNFLGKLELPEIGDDGRINAPVVSIDKHNFAGSVRTFVDNQENSVVLFNDNQEISGYLKCYDNPTQRINGSSWSPFDQGGEFYRFEQEIRYYRGFTDTIFTYNKEDVTFEPFIIIDYGKYKSTLNFDLNGENPDLIKVYSINENDGYVFFDFGTMNASPEPYEDEIYRAGSLRKFINHTIKGIYDKKKKTFHFLLQPIKGIQGLENDIDKGIPFLVRSVSSKNQLVDYHHAYKFIEYAESLPALSGPVADIVKQISEEYNPIVIIAE